MKVRVDYVSNSSSSSYIIYGTKMDRELTIEDFASLKDGEAFIVDLTDTGCSGNYVYTLTPEMFMDFDLHQIDIKNRKDIVIYKAKYISAEGFRVGRGNKFDIMEDWRSDYWYDNNEGYELSNKMLEGDGIDLTGLKMFKIEKDQNTPSNKSEILDSFRQ